MTKPGVGSLHHPSLGNHLKTRFRIRALEMFQLPTKLLLDLGDKRFTCKGAVNPDDLQTGPQPSPKRRQQDHPTWCDRPKLTDKQTRVIHSRYPDFDYDKGCFSGHVLWC